MPEENNIFELFHPTIADWFKERFGEPTDVQRQAWPKIADGRHVLITAPTGSGKTLTAFLWAIHQLAAGKLRTGGVRILYVSPLKALNNDIQRNLLAPLAELKVRFERNDVPFPDIRVLTRSGDTPQSDRRRMLRHPPEILITTPESLNLMLSSKSGVGLLTRIAGFILDEIHAVVGNKRGVHLITAVERLVPLSGEFQRIALSATVRPLETVAEFIGGFKIGGSPGTPLYTPRPVTVVQSSASKFFDVQVRFPEQALQRPARESLWEPLVKEIKNIIAGNRSTLVFVNSRKLCEKITLMINREEEWPLAYAHHGSLSREIRGAVERKLKAGQLKAIVATNSLEMGIDIGALDTVLLIQSPFSITSAIQRVGRAGHQVGQVSRGVIFPTHAHDFLQAAVLTTGIHDQDIETVRPVQGALDVLAQIILSMTGVEPWDTDALFTHLKASYPYRHLQREQFELVLNMLAGRYAGTRIRELKPRISLDRLDNTVEARKGALLALYTSGGTIPNRGYFRLIHADTAARIGELDEEFVWEASIGQTFTLGTQNWKIERITHNDVLVLPGNPQAAAAPFWKGETGNRDFHFSERIGFFLAAADTRLQDPRFKQDLHQTRCLDRHAADQLLSYLKQQKEITGCALPHRHHLLIEDIHRGPGGAPGSQIVLHTFWGGRVNRPLAMALTSAWQIKYGHRPEIFSANDHIVIQLAHPLEGDELLSLVTASNVLDHLRNSLEGSGFFGARFRECAGRALLVTRNKFNERLPLWMSRLRSQKLLESVKSYEDFPILLEAWRTCFQDEFDLDSLCRVLTELESGSIAWSRIRTGRPSPMARNAAWVQINQYMYQDDQPPADTASRLRGDLLQQLVFDPGLRPTIKSEIVRQFEEKRQRLSPGYAPAGSRDLLDWVKERVAIPYPEWQNLLQAVAGHHGMDPAGMLAPVAAKLVRIEPALGSTPLVAALEDAPRLSQGLYAGLSRLKVGRLDTGEDISVSELEKLLPSDLQPEETRAALIGQWLQFYGPVTVDFVSVALGIALTDIQPALNDLIDAGILVSGRLTDPGESEEICDSQNFEMLLRLARKAAVPDFSPLGFEMLQLLLARIQGMAQKTAGVDELAQCIERLVCLPVPAAAWEADVLPARVDGYDPSWLDTLTQESDLMWLGEKGQKVAFCFQSDLDLFKVDDDRRGASQKTGNHSNSPDEGAAENNELPAIDPDLQKLMPDPQGRYDFGALLQDSDYSATQLSERLWETVWSGQVTNDTFGALRRGIEHRFKAPDLTQFRSRSAPARRRGRVGFGSRRWTNALPYAGYWHQIPLPEATEDLIEIEERKKDRVRLLLERYGILFRELLYREKPGWRWADIFRTLRLMELSGELLAGYFFHDIPGPQFMSHQAFRLLTHGLPEDAVYWLNAADPASLCGTPLTAVKSWLPKRLAGTHLVFHGPKLVVVSRRHARQLTLNVESNDPRLPEYFAFLQHLLRRRSQPLRQVTIERINAVEAARSGYVDALRTAFDVIIDYKQVILYRRES